MKSNKSITTLASDKMNFDFDKKKRKKKLQTKEATKSNDWFQSKNKWLFVVVDSCLCSDLLSQNVRVNLKSVTQISDKISLPILCLFTHSNWINNEMKLDKAFQVNLCMRLHCVFCVFLRTENSKWKIAWKWICEKISIHESVDAKCGRSQNEKCPTERTLTDKELLRQHTTGNNKCHGLIKF